MKQIFIVILLTLGSFSAQGQIRTFTHQDSLRGSITPERAWWDLIAYRLKVNPDIQKKSISGSNWVVFKTIEDGGKMQIDLQQPMAITKVTHQDRDLKYQREGNVYYINFETLPIKGQLDSIYIEFQGNPKISNRPPWDGGLTWSKDELGNDFVATSVQGDGASLWWPCKDHMYDEVEQMDIILEVAKPLVGVANGRLVKTEDQDNSRVFHWHVSNPINNYGVNMNIGNYTNFKEEYSGENGILDLDYYVLENHLVLAKEQFKQVPMMLEAFEYWFGPYPFYRDSFKLVEVPYLGMEHQSSVTYGNGFKNGYLGSDLSGTGWGLKFDFIIIHEAGHEWFANNITNIDIADMWIHESFTAYSESLYLEYFYGKQAGQEYVIGTRRNIQNDRPIIGFYNVNHSGSGDMYYKGSNMINTIRTWLNNDGQWREVLRGLNKDFYHQTVDTKTIEHYIIDQTGLPLQGLFDQYLRTTEIPQLDIKIKDHKIHYRYCEVLKNFNLPLRININGKEIEIQPNQKWQTLKLDAPIESLEIDPNYYIRINKSS